MDKIECGEWAAEVHSGGATPAENSMREDSVGSVTWMSTNEITGCRRMGSRHCVFRGSQSRNSKPPSHCVPLFGHSVNSVLKYVASSPMGGVVQLQVIIAAKQHI